SRPLTPRKPSSQATQVSFCATIPKRVKSVLIMYGEWKAPIKCDVQFALYSGQTVLNVNGIEPATIAGTFYELDRELRLRSAWGGWIYDAEAHFLVWLLGFAAAGAMATSLAYWSFVGIQLLIPIKFDANNLRT